MESTNKATAMLLEEKMGYFEALNTVIDDVLEKMYRLKHCDEECNTMDEHHPNYIIYQGYAKVLEVLTK